MQLKILSLFCLFCFCALSCSAQKILLIEKYGKAKTKKIYKGEWINYKLFDDDIWYEGVIEDFNLDQNLIVFGDRYVSIEKIEKIRYTRSWAKKFGPTLFWFGTGWSLFAAVGTATDGNDDTRYRWSDAIVTGTSWLLALVVPKVFKYKTYKFGKKRRLRIIDISIIPTKEPAKAIPVP